jgi:hypothetical protein
MAGGEFLNQAGDSSKLISWKGVRDDEDPTVGAFLRISSPGVSTLQTEMARYVQFSNITVPYRPFKS